LLIGTVSKFISAVSVSFNEDTCGVKGAASVVWGSDTESMISTLERIAIAN